MKAAATGDMDAFAREYNAIPDGYTTRSGEPEDRKVRRRRCRQGNIGTSAGGQPLVRSFDNSDEALGMLAASAGDPKTVTEWLESQAHRDVNLEKALLAQEASMARTNAAYGARQGSITRSGGGSPDKPKDPYSGISIKTPRTFTATNARSSPTHGRSTTSGQKQTRCRGCAERERASCRSEPDDEEGRFRREARNRDRPEYRRLDLRLHQFPTAEKGAQGAFITLRRDQDPEPGFVQQNGGTITKEQQEAFLCGPPELAERLFRARRAGRLCWPLNGCAQRRAGCGANHRTQELTPAARAAYNAMHNIQVLSKMPANEQKARPTGTDKDPKFTPQELEAGERGWRQAAIQRRSQDDV